MIAALERLMTDLACAGSVAEFEDRWVSSPSPFAAVSVRSWEEHVGGGAEVEFAPGAGPSLAQLEAAFGAFSEPPRAPAGRRHLRGTWWKEGMPARVVLLVYSPPPADESLERIMVQRGELRPA